MSDHKSIDDATPQEWNDLVSRKYRQVSDKPRSIETRGLNNRRVVIGTSGVQLLRSYFIKMFG